VAHSVVGLWAVAETPSHCAPPSPSHSEKQQKILDVGTVETAPLNKVQKRLQAVPLSSSSSSV